MRSRVVLIVATMVVAAGAGAALWVSTRDDNQLPEMCRGIGFLTETIGATPDEAMSTYVRSVGGDPADWVREGGTVGALDSENYTGQKYRPLNSAAMPSGFVSISVDRFGPDEPLEGRRWVPRLGEDVAALPAIGDALHGREAEVR
jgi:hypothetical protein